jgi:putative transcriptional regulator
MNNKLRDIRLEQKLTQQDLADQLLVSRQTVISIESGKYSPSLELAFKISKLFEINIEDIFFP